MIHLAQNPSALKDPSKQGYVPSDGTILASTSVQAKPGATVFDVLTETCRNNNIQIEYSYYSGFQSYYIEGINHLYEFDGGQVSGWLYKVNGVFPNYGCSAYTLQDGDSISLLYTCDEWCRCRQSMATINKGGIFMTESICTRNKRLVSGLLATCLLLGILLSSIFPVFAFEGTVQELPIKTIPENATEQRFIWSYDKEGIVEVTETISSDTSNANNPRFTTHSLYAKEAGTVTVTGTLMDTTSSAKPLVFTVTVTEGDINEGGNNFSSSETKIDIRIVIFPPKPMMVFTMACNI